MDLIQFESIFQILLNISQNQNQKHLKKEGKTCLHIDCYGAQFARRPNNANIVNVLDIRQICWCDIVRALHVVRARADIVATKLGIILLLSFHVLFSQMVGWVSAGLHDGWIAGVELFCRYVL